MKQRCSKCTLNPVSSPQAFSILLFYDTTQNLESLNHGIVFVGQAKFLQPIFVQKDLIKVRLDGMVRQNALV